jgi:hypothetical protein
LALSVPLSRFTSRVGGGSAFFVRRLAHFMRISHYITIGAVVLVAVFFAGCSKKPTQQKSEAFAKMFPNESLPTNVAYLGVVELSTRTPSHLTIDTTNDCTITTAALPDGSLQMDVAVETSGQQPARTRIIARPDQQFAFQTGSMTRMVSYTAKLIDK